ncbi:MULTISPECIES: chalcone isomerase family protein [unclassified Vibrio]|uniref:Chalcone isomerase family protein n=1 Tax=Vibrio sp. HB236076 TaxID=3232307 RepID=A0AB39HDI2_9VIBR|nr:chalcone isomerase family protein [Vibrio sp. HB161653]MDP5253650.1 chalcone isomerase family protein [Vibrio sp. HB161653]
MSAFANDTQTWSEWPVVGKARLSWFLFDVYDSQLLSPSGNYQTGMPSKTQPLALALTYLRSISSQQLVEATQEQWQKMGLDEQEYTPWLAILPSVFPDVKKGDSLALVSDGQGCQFYQQSSRETSMRLSQSIDKKEFCRAFLGIWLGANTQYPKLRNALIGVSDEQ